MATAPGGISESRFSLQALGSEFFERFQSANSLEKQFGHVVETGQLTPGRPVRPTHLPFLQVMTPGRRPPSRRVYPARQVSASGHLLNLRGLNAEVCQAAAARPESPEKGQGPSAVNIDRAASEEFFRPSQWLRGESTSSQPSLPSKQLDPPPPPCSSRALQPAPCLRAAPPARSQEAGAEPRVGTHDVTPAREAGLWEPQCSAEGRGGAGPAARDLLQEAGTGRKV